MRNWCSRLSQAYGLAGYIVQHPALARFHAGLVNAVAEHVVVVAHDDAIQCVDDLALVAFDVQVRARRVLLHHCQWYLYVVIAPRSERSAKCVEVGDREVFAWTAVLSAAACSSGPNAASLALFVASWADIPHPADD